MVNFMAIVSVHSLALNDDVTGNSRTRGSRREFTQEERWYADEEIQAGADRDVATTNRIANRVRCLAQVLINGTY
jgi:hypothetical protein